MNKSNLEMYRNRTKPLFPVPSYLGVHKDVLEKRIKDKRENTDRNLDKWKQFSDYIKKVTVNFDGS